MRPQTIATILLTGILAVNVPADVSAQTYPPGAITFIVPYAAGGSADIVARIIGAKLQDRFGKPVVIENRPGGSEIVAIETLARSAPDGLTIAILSNALAINETLIPNRRYDTRQDLVPVVRLIELPFAILVHPSVPANSIKELVALAKAKPGTLNYGHLGPGSPHFFTMEWFKRTAGVDIVGVPYRGASPAYAALITGEVQVVASGLGAATPFLEARQVRPLATISSKRPSTLPDLPTMAEAGYSDFNLISWMGIFVRSGTPAPIIEKLQSEFLLALESPDVTGRLTKLGLEPSPMPSRAFSEFLAAEIVNWARVVNETSQKPH
jgi:tripartite-type tricarboxylate transporter receptor subunit TctC